MVQNYNFFVKPQSKSQPFSKKNSKTADFLASILILPTWWQHDILHVVSLLEQWRDFIICHAYAYVSYYLFADKRHDTIY